jgi:5-oxoprolinase (ATP-hydrolysing) subunit A
MPERVIDINSDLGESYGAFQIGADQQLFPLISSANVACGFHGGDPRTIDRTVKTASAQGVRIGAHPSYPDLVGFGRRVIAATPDEIYADLLYQLGALDAFCRANGVAMQHVKAHGALNNVAAKDVGVAEAIAAAVKAFDPNLLIYAMPQSAMIIAAEHAGLPIVREAFADRAYNPDATLVARSKPGAMVTDPAEAAERMSRLITEGRIRTIDGDDLLLEADSICVHSDTPTAVAIATALRERFVRDGIVVRAPGMA